MRPHVKLTIADIDQEIAELQQLRDGLDTLFGGETELPPPVKVKKTRKTKALGKYARRNNAGNEVADPAPAGVSRNPTQGTAGFTRAPSADMVELMAAARKLPEPISATTLSVASGKDRVFCTNSITRWAAKGWLQKTAYGEYKRTNMFPAQA